MDKEKDKDKEILDTGQEVKLQLLLLTKQRIEQSQELNDILTIAQKELIRRLTDPDAVQDINTQTLAVVIKEFHKLNNDLAQGLVASTNKSPMIAINNTNGSVQNPNAISDEKEISTVTKDEFTTAKNLIDFMNKVKQNDLSVDAEIISNSDEKG